MTEAAAPKKPAQWVSIVGFLVIMASLWFVLLVKTPTVTAEGVAGQLQVFSDDLNRDGAKAGRQAVLSYGAITLEGTGYEKYVVIKNLHFSVSAKVGVPSGNLTLDTDKVSVTLDPLNKRRMIFSLADPITLTENGQKKTVITLPTPLKLGYFQNNHPKAIENIHITLRLPSDVSLARGADNAGVAPSPVIVSYDGLPEINIKYNDAAKEWKEAGEWSNIIMRPGNEQDIDVGAVATRFNEKMGTDNKLAGMFSFSVSDFIRRENGKAIATCSLTSNIDYSTNQSLVGFFGVPDKATVTADLKKMLITCDDFTVQFEGQFGFQPGDSLPSGTITVAVDNTKALLASAMLSEQTRNELAAALPKITGQPLEGMTKLTIPVKRTPGGLLMLGAVTSQDAGITAVSQWFPAR